MTKQKELVRAVCYKTVEPTVYNKGTQWETTCDEFLAYLTYETLEDVQAECERLNAEKPNALWNGRPVDWTQVAYFYAVEQEDC